MKKFFLFAGLGILGLLGYLVYSELIWQPDPAVFAKPKADCRAREHLVKYAKEQHVSFYEFKGPYFTLIKAIDPPVYIVCYSHPQHYFCYSDWEGNIAARPLRPGESLEEYKAPEYQGWD